MIPTNLVEISSVVLEKKSFKRKSLRTTDEGQMKDRRCDGQTMDRWWTDDGGYLYFM